ncbi:MAG: TolC family protein [Armatimonadetes bacterium]|nr:TolC family protein [Armatimonadota bacterium]
MRRRLYPLAGLCAAAVLAAGLAGSLPPAAAQAARPITLAEALTLAAQNNIALRVAAFETTVARAQLAQAEGLKSGQLVLTASYTRINEREGGTIVIPPGVIPGIPTPITITLPPPTPNIYSAALTYQYALHSGGRIESQIALAQANLKGAEATLERARQQLVLDVKQAYFQLLLAQAGVEVGVRILAAAEENLRVARARVAAGVSPRFDEVQAEVNFANARQGLIRARTTVALANHALNALLALPLDTALQPREMMTLVPVRTPVDALVRRALERRPELAEHRARVEAALAAIEIARSNGRPALILSGGPNYGNTTGGSASGVVATGWSVTLAATVPLFDGGVTAQRIREAETRVEQLRAAEAQLRQGIELDVRRALLNFASAAEELAAADKIIEQAQEGLRIANVRFTAGVSTNLEVIQAQSALSQAEANRIQALFNVNLARAQLERAVGSPVE